MYIFMYVLLVCDLICMHVYKYVCPFLFPFGLTRVAWLILVKANKLPSHGLSYRAIWVSALYLYLNALLTLVTQLKHVQLYTCTGAAAYLFGPIPKYGSVPN